MEESNETLSVIDVAIEWASIFHDKLALRCVSTIRSENNKYFRRAGEEKRGRKIETRYICIYKIEYGRQRERSRG